MESTFIEVKCRPVNTYNFSDNDQHKDIDVRHLGVFSFLCLIFYLENLIEITLGTTKISDITAYFQTVVFIHLDQCTDLENTLVMQGIATIC